MYELMLLEDDDKSYLAWYALTININSLWKKNYEFSCHVEGVDAIPQGDLSDFEYFKRIKKLEPKMDKKYLLLLSYAPVGLVSVYESLEHTASISIAAIPNRLFNECQINALDLIEKELFKDTNIHSIRLIEGMVSIFLADKFGYVYDTEVKAFIKERPDIDLIYLETGSRSLSNKRFS